MADLLTLFICLTHPTETFFGLIQVGSLTIYSATTELLKDIP